MDKSVETFCKTNAFKLTIILLFWMKTHFFSIVNPLPHKQCCKTLCWCLFVSNGGRGGCLSRLGERRIHNWGKYNGNFHMSQQLLSMIVGCSKPMTSKCCLTAGTFVWSSFRLFAMPDSTSILPAASCWDSELWLISFVILCSVESGLWPFSTVCAVVATVFCCSLTAGCPIGKPVSSVSYYLHGYPLLWGSPALPSYHQRTSMCRRNKHLNHLWCQFQLFS